jgi:hypothetical protein
VAPSEPQQSYVSAFIEPTLRRALEAAARLHDRSLSGELRVALRSYLSSDPSDALSPSSGDLTAEGKEAS